MDTLLIINSKSGLRRNKDSLGASTEPGDLAFGISTRIAEPAGATFLKADGALQMGQQLGAADARPAGLADAIH